MKSIIIFVLLFTEAYAQQRSDSFIIRMFDDKVRIVAPDKRQDQVSLIIENSGLSKVYASLEGRKHIYKVFSLEPNSKKSFQLDEIVKNDNLTILPISPGFQEIPLIFGQKAYEIPPKE
jgi:hypothetical protein